MRAKTTYPGAKKRSPAHTASGKALSLRREPGAKVEPGTSIGRALLTGKAPGACAPGANVCALLRRLWAEPRQFSRTAVPDTVTMSMPLSEPSTS